MRQKDGQTHPNALISARTTGKDQKTLLLFENAVFAASKLFGAKCMVFALQHFLTTLFAVFLLIFFCLFLAPSSSRIAKQGIDFT